MSDVIVRRDPRAEWIMRNRLHPLHDQYAQPAAEVRGPSGLIRKNPHGVGFMGPNGLKRIDRLAGNAVAAGPVRGLSGRTAAKTELPLKTVADPAFYVVVVPDLVGGRLSAHDKDVLGQARALVDADDAPGAVLAVIFGESREQGFGAAGADRVLHLEGAAFNGYSPETRCAALTEVERRFQPRHWLFPDSVQGGADLGRRLAARLGERAATQAWQVDAEGVLCRGGAGTLDIRRATPRLLLLAEECAEPVSEARFEARPVTTQAGPALLPRIQDQGPVAVDPNAVPLGEAEFILSAGNGITDWDGFHRAAELLGATEGASRVAVDGGFMPRARQVGATGTWVTARVYIAVGISGAVQHMQGIGQCDKVVAINTDPGCDMVKRADLSVIGDSSEVLAALMRRVEAYRAEGAEDAA